MSSNRRQGALLRTAAAGALVLGVAAGSFGIANAASGSGSSSSSATTAAAAAAATTPSTPSGQQPSSGQPWGGQRSDETLLTGDTASKVKELALAKVSGGTVVRVETDADGHAAYEAHMVKQDGTPATVYVDNQFNVVSVETR